MQSPDVPDEIFRPEPYSAVASRRAQFDNLLWQVPVLTLTAQAFLFTVALAPDSRRAARVIACLLSLVMTVLTLQLLSRHRQAEITDAEWLAEYERKHFGGLAVHGPAWRQRRNRTNADAWWFTPLAKLPGFGLGLSACPCSG